MTEDPTAPSPPFRTAEGPPEKRLLLFGPEELAEQLQKIQSITDAVLAHLEMDALLDELLRRIRSVLGTDTASVLLCADDGETLSVRASQGLPDDIQRNVRIPLGQGIAGRVAVRREAVIVDDVSLVQVANPALHHIRSMVVAPLIAGSKLLGVLHSGTFELRTFRDWDLHLLQIVADRVALAVRNSLLYERTQAEAEERARGEERFRRLVEGVKDYGIFMLDPQGNVASWNQGAERIKGYTEDEVVGQHFSIFYLPDDRVRGWPEFELTQAASAGRFEDEGWRVRKDGSHFWANVVITALYRGTELVGFTKVTRDLTERKRAEEALRESEERFRVFSESASDAIFAIDDRSTILYTNPAVERIFGYSVDELRGQSMTLLVPERQRAAHRAGVEHHSATGERRIPWTGVQLPGLHKDGREIPLEISFGEYSRDGRRHYTGIARDVSERVHQQQVLEETAAELEAMVEELRQRSEEAEAANRAKSDFLAVMSHELRTPLNAVMGYADLLIAGVPSPIPEPSLRYVERIEAAARHQLELIEEILTFTNLVAGRAEVHREAVDLGAVIREAAWSVTPAAETKGLQIGVQEPDTPLVVETDPDKVRQVLISLLSNAVKFTRRGEIRIWTDVADEVARVHVHDTGVGIAAEHLTRVFEPFWQVEQSNTREAGGSGMGLAVSRRIAQLLGGNLEVDSVPGEGTTASFSLPHRGTNLVS
jgi:PAS domain S-box-containing protein